MLIWAETVMTNSRYTIALAILFGVLSVLSACANTDEEAQTDLRSAADADPSSQDGETLSPDVPNEIIGPGDDLPEELQVAAREWTGDLDGMVERGYIRALVVYNRTGYFLDGPQQKGITYEALKEFEKFVNQKLKLRRIKLELYFLPVRRDELLPALAEGSGDLAAANLTITPERQQLVDFSIPAAENVRELVVTGPNAPLCRRSMTYRGKKFTYVSQAAILQAYAVSTTLSKKPARTSYSFTWPMKISRMRICWRWSTPGSSRL